MKDGREKVPGVPKRSMIRHWKKQGLRNRRRSEKQPERDGLEACRGDWVFETKPPDPGFNGSRSISCVMTDGISGTGAEWQNFDFEQENRQ